MNYEQILSKVKTLKTLANVLYWLGYVAIIILSILSIVSGIMSIKEDNTSVMLIISGIIIFIVGKPLLTFIYRNCAYDIANEFLKGELSIKSLKFAKTVYILWIIIEIVVLVFKFDFWSIITLLYIGYALYTFNLMEKFLTQTGQGENSEFSSYNSSNTYTNISNASQVTKTSDTTHIIENDSPISGNIPMDNPDNDLF